MTTEAPSQTDLFDPEIVQRFEAWKQTPGARKILQMAYALTAPYAETFQKTGQRVSIKLIWELLRYHVASDAGLEPENGYRLNNDFTPLLSRHIVRHRPEWNGVFELRERHTKE